MFGMMVERFSAVEGAAAHPLLLRTAAQGRPAAPEKVTNPARGVEGVEVELLAEWVWKSFHPGQTMSKEVTKEEAAKILRRCDVDGDGKVSPLEFEVYYGRTAEAMAR